MFLHEKIHHCLTCTHKRPDDVDDGQELRNRIRSFCKDQKISVYGTQNISQAVSTVAARANIYVNIIELPANANESIQATCMLKVKRPALISIVLTEEIDAETAVDLINSGQIFLYLSKPLKTEILAEVIQQALAPYELLKNNPQSQQRYRVNKPKGSKQYSAQYQEERWHFSSAENIKLFTGNPVKYARQYGGYRAYAVSRNTTASIKPELFTVVDNKLYLNYSKVVQRRW